VLLLVIGLHLFLSLPKALAGTPQSELELGWECQLSDLVTALVCAPGAGWAASSAAGEVVWSSGSNQRIYLQEANGRSIDRVAFSADGRWLAAGGQAGKLLIWDCGDRQLPPQLVRTIEIDRWIEHLAWHPSQPQLAIGSGNRANIWDAIADTEVTTWTFDRSSIFDLAWHPGGTALAVAGYKGVQIWTPSAPTDPPERLDVDTATIAIAWSSDGRYLAAANLDRTLTIFARQQPDDLWTLQGCEGKIRQLAWLAGTETPCLAVASGTDIVLWTASADATTWEGRLLAGHQDIVTAAIAHPQAPKLASGGADGYTCIWTADGQIEQILSHPIVSRFTQLSWHPDRLYLATGTQSGHICLWLSPA
jgi:WD40 repeat protein